MRRAGDWLPIFIPPFSHGAWSRGSSCFWLHCFFSGPFRSSPGNAMGTPIMMDAAATITETPWKSNPITVITAAIMGKRLIMAMNTAPTPCLGCFFPRS
jgi:hypothetical protein